MRVIIAGGRDINDYSLVEKAVKNSGWAISEIVSGGAKGADQLGEHYAIQNGIKWNRFPANWDLHGPVRNGEMARYTAKWEEDGEDGGGLIAIWDGESKGTKNMVEQAKGKGLQVYIELTK
jgi:hypothetical protein